MSKARQLKNDLLMLYDVADVKTGFEYWFFKLLNYCLGMFEYDGLPKSLPQREIELNLILTGHAVIFANKGELVCIRSELYGYNEYYSPTNAVYGNVKIKSKDLKIGDNCEVIFNNYIRGNVLDVQLVDSGLRTFICRYARLLSDIESTIDIRLVNSRQTSYSVATSNQMAEQLKNLNRELEAGHKSIITDNPFVEAFRTIDVAEKKDTEKINDLLIARDKILSMFFREIGIKFEQEQKRAQLTEDEVTADEQLLLINPYTMLEEREAGIERVNNIFGTDISVKLNPNFDRTTYIKTEEVNVDDTSTAIRY